MYGRSVTEVCVQTPFIETIVTLNWDLLLKYTHTAFSLSNVCYWLTDGDLSSLAQMLWWFFPSKRRIMIWIICGYWWIKECQTRNHFELFWVVRNFIHCRLWNVHCTCNWIDELSSASLIIYFLIFISLSLSVQYYWQYNIMIPLH